VEKISFMQPVDFSAILTDAPRDCWLALSEDGSKLVAWGETMEDAVNKAKANGVDEPLMYWSPDEAISRILGAHVENFVYGDTNKGS
jgi:hypothetical protein